MTLGLCLAFLAASAALVAIPGPNVGLIVANSLTHGRRFGLLTVAGTSSAMAIQLAVAVAGMASLLAVMAPWFEVLRWVGVAYLGALAILAFRAGPDAVEARPSAPDGRAIYARGVLVGLTNPKTLLFYGAFLPQFVDRAHPATPQLILLAVSFLAVAVIGDSLWALAADRLKRLVQGRGRLRNRIAGSIYLAAGTGLAAARAP